MFSGRRCICYFLPIALVGFVPAWAQDVSFTINASVDGPAIPDGVYGVNELGYSGSTVNRHGGNRHTGWNWENNASNAGADYNHQSDSYLGSLAGIGNSQTSGALMDAWVNADRAQNLKSIFTLPLAGYVAADMNGPVSSAQKAPSSRWKQVVFQKGSALSLTPDVTDGVVYLDEMVNFAVTRFGKAANGGIAGYNLDNEPALWPSTHPRIHPAAPTYVEVATKNSQAAAVVLAVDDTAEIYGPTLYGWSAHQNLQNAPDSGTHNSTYGSFTNYYLAHMKSASDAAGKRLLHRYDMHWYPEARGDHRIVFETSTPAYGTSADIDARLQAPRSLWDPSYIENSWITQYTTNGQGIRLLPRLRECVAQYFPGTGLAVTEYNYGGTGHISGGVAQADVLGIFGEYQTTACFWPITSDNSYVAAAFRLYRNYDGAGSAYGNISLSATASDNSRAGIHAARRGSKVTIVAVNRSRTASRSARFAVNLPAGQTISGIKVFRLDATGGAAVQVLTSAPVISENNFDDSLPPMSATLYEVTLATAGTFSAWQQEMFGPDAGNATIAGAGADPDGDGLSNLLEYALVRNPKRGDARTVLEGHRIVAVPGAELQLEFNRRKHLPDVQLLLQQSALLSPATWADMDLATLPTNRTDIDAATERWTITVTGIEAVSSYFRLKATR